MNVYEQIDSIFSGEAEDKPQWASELLQEIKIVKTLLMEQKKFLEEKNYNKNSSYQKRGHGLYKFVQRFRLSMKADAVNNIYPTFRYKGRELGVDYSGLLYDKKDSKTLSRVDAFEVYKYAYKCQKEYEISA